MDKTRTWLKGRQWYRPEYKKASDITCYITLFLAVALLANLFVFSIREIEIILYGFLLTGAAIAITLSQIDRHEQKLSQLRQ